jgi:Predicted membrane protein
LSLFRDQGLVVVGRRSRFVVRARPENPGESVSNPLRIGRFAGVGLLGFLLQITALWWLTAHAHWSWMTATPVAVELAVVHNYLWHARWTWRDRPGGSPVRFVRFQLANGVASIAGNAALMALFAGAFGLPPMPANALAVGVMVAVNFVAADRWVFGAVQGLGARS